MNKVGQALHEQRMSLGISIEEASNKTKIQKVYLEAIEKGDFAFFKNQEFYQQVFVGSYAKFLNLDKNELIDLLDDDNKAYLQNPSVDAFTPKHAEEIIEREHQELEAQVEPVHDDFEIVEEAVPAKEEEINEEVDDRIESRHSNPHVLEKYMYQIEDPKLKEIEDQIKRKKEEEALNELNQPVIADEIEKETTEAPQVEGDLKLDEVNEEVLNDNEVEDNEAEEVNNIDINNIAPASEINLDNLDNTGRDISSLLDEIERSEDNFKEEPTIGELIDENKDITNETTIDSQSELEDLLSSLNNQVIVNEEQMVQDSDNNEELLNSDIINDVEIIK
ncbi:MAG: helix-turn-helix domain-containing protein, partial [Bacilli bacterium]|nr:helix-turn-helix domain-containing protein [Bacilli bacterium]